MIRRRILIAVSILSLVVASAIPTTAEPQRQIPNVQLSTSLNVNITSVRSLGIIGDDTTQVIEVTWTASAGDRIDLINFKVEGTATHNDGFTENTSVTTVGPTIRTARVRALYRGGEDFLTAFNMKVTASFRNQITNVTSTRVATSAGNF